MTSIGRILKSRSGTSIILVGCVALILFFIGGSVLFAASNTSGAQLRRQETAICAAFAKDFARNLTESITGEISGDTPWKSIAQGAYDKNPTGGHTLVTLSNAAASLSPSDGSAELWVFESGSVQLEFNTTKVEVVITRPYVAPVPAVYGERDEDGNRDLIAPAVKEVLEQAEIAIMLTADITVQRGESSYLLRANYEFSGTTEGNSSGAGTGKISSGGWTLLGYEQQ